MLLRAVRLEAGGYSVLCAEDFLCHSALSVAGGAATMEWRLPNSNLIVNTEQDYFSHNNRGPDGSLGSNGRGQGFHQKVFMGAQSDEHDLKA